MLVIIINHDYIVLSDSYILHSVLLIILQEVSDDEMSILSSADLTVEELAMKSMLIRTRRKVRGSITIS